MDREIKDDFIENPTKYEMLEQEFDKLLEDRKYLREWAMENGEDKRPLPGIVLRWCYSPGISSLECGADKQLSNRSNMRGHSCEG